MSQGQGGSTSENVDRPPGTRRRRRFFRRSIEKKNPGNAEFERQVAAIEARQEQERMRLLFAILGWDNLTDESGEDDSQVAPNDHPKDSLGRASSEPKQQKENSNSDFLEGTFLKISSDKQKVATNKKNSKNKKKKKGKSRKRYHASEMQSELCTEPSSACANAGTSGENLPFSSSNHVAIDVPLWEYSSSSSSSRVTELISPVSSISSSNDKELSSNSNDFKSFSTSSYYSVASSPVNDYSSGSNASATNDSYVVSNAWNNTGTDDAGSLSDVRTEWSCSATGVTDDYRGFNKWSGNRNKQNGHESFSVTISHSSSSQEASLCGDDASHDGEFQKVISRKIAQKMKRIQSLQSPTPSPTISSSLPICSTLVPRAPSEITLGHYIKDDCFSGRKPNHKKGKYHKGRRLVSTGFTDEENVPGQSRMLDITVHPENLDSSQMALSSISDHRVALEIIEENCSSGCLPLPSQGELKDLAPVDPGNAKDTDSGAAFSDKTSSLESCVHVNCSSTVDWEEQKKEENEQVLSSYESKFDKIIKAVNDAYEIQVADRTCSHPVADIENFLQSATPVIGQVPCTTSNSCMLGQPVCSQMQNVALRSVWQWYEKPESFGIEVERQRSINNHPSGTYSWSRLCAYFVPSLSAVQLFGKSPNDGGLLFEYFEREKPFLRPPLFTKIKQLVSGKNPSGNPMFGDPKQLDSVKLSDLHPASWYCVAWYPIYQIPSAHRSCQASFLTYHSLGKLVPKNCSKDVAEGLTPIICPIVGLHSLKCHGEKWFHPGEQLGSKPTSEGSMEITAVEHLNMRLEALKHSASAMSKAVVPRATGEFMNYHPDYAFFCTRAL